MAESGPQTSVSLGGDLLAAMGDIKGAAKALGEEARSAKQDVKEADTELKNIEKRRRELEKQITTADKKGAVVSPEIRQQLAQVNAERDKATAILLERQDRANKLQFKASGLKEEVKDKRERETAIRDEMTKYDRRFQHKIFKIRDGVDGVARRLLESNSELAQRAGATLLSATNKIDVESMATVTKIGGGIKLAGITTAATIGVFEIAKKFIMHDEAATIIRSQTSDAVKDYMQRITNVTEGSEAIADFVTGKTKEEAVKQVKEMSGLDPEGFFGKYFFGGDVKVEKVIQDMLKEKTSYGRNLAELAKTEGINESVDRLLDRESIAMQVARSGFAKNVAERFGISTRWFGLETRAELEYKEAQRQETEYWKNWTAVREEAKRKQRADIAGSAMMHENATRIQNIERQRMKNKMDWAAF